MQPGRAIAQYVQGLEGNPSVELLVPFAPDLYDYQMFGIRTDYRDALMIELKSKGIATGCHYTPLSVQPLFAQWGGTCPFIEAEVNRCITLPLHADLTPSEVEYVIDSINAYNY